MEDFYGKKISEYRRIFFSIFSALDFFDDESRFQKKKKIIK